MKKRWSANVIAFFLVAGIIVLLLNTGSAKAFNLILSVLDNTVQKGEKINFNATIEVEADDGVLQIDEFKLRLLGPNNIECRFMPNGTIITKADCPGIKITKIKEAPQVFGYGYNGYGEGFFEYAIEIDTDDYMAGLYESHIVMIREGNENDKRGEDIRIVVPPEELKGCSLRAVQGVVDVNGTVFNERNNKLSFFISKNRNKPIEGHGYLVSQKGRQRFEYDFDIDEVLENNKTSATMIVSGKYKINRGAEKTLNTIITFSKERKNGVVNIEQIPIDDITASNMKISFLEGCNR